MDIELIKKRIKEAEAEGDTQKVKRLKSLLAKFEEDEVTPRKSRNSSDYQPDVKQEDKEKKKEEKEDKERRDEEKQEEQDARQTQEQNKSNSAQTKKGNTDTSSAKTDSSPKSSGTSQGVRTSAKGTQAGSTTTGGTAAGGGAAAGGTAAGGSAAAGGTAAGGAAVGGTAAGGATAGGAAAVAATPVGWVILIIIAVILIIMIIIGIISFFTTMPGLVRGKIEEFLGGLWQEVQIVIKGDEKLATRKQITETGKYLESMGYSLEGFGFVEKEEDISRDLEGNITDVKSKYIGAYLASDIKTYLITDKNFSFEALFSDDFFDGPSGWGLGMIRLDEEFWDWIGLVPGVDILKDILGTVSIDRENKVMEISRLHFDWFNTGYDKYSYNLNGWVGKYSKPLEFLLSLHLATLAPDFAYEVATRKEIDTEVVLKFMDITIKVDMYTTKRIEEGEHKGDRIYGEYKKISEITAEQREIYTEVTDAVIEASGALPKEVLTKVPYITEVNSHWYKNLDFTGCYDTVDEPSAPIYYRYSPEEESVLEGFWIQEIKQQNIVQIKEPERIDNSETIKELLDEKYIIYNGTAKTQEEKGESYKRKIDFMDETADKNKSVDTILDGIAMLERVEGEDAQHILRDLRELLAEVGVNLSSTDDKALKQVAFDWVMPDYEPEQWPTVEEEPALEYYTLIKKATPDVVGFDASKRNKIVAPANGKITKIETITEGEVTYNSVEITFEGVEPVVIDGDTGQAVNPDANGMVFTISGINLGGGLVPITEGTVVTKGDIIGQTLDLDVQMKLRTAEMEYVRVADYILPDKFKEVLNVYEYNFIED